MYIFEHNTDYNKPSEGSIFISLWEINFFFP